MAPLFELAGPDLDPGYLNLRAAEYIAEQVIKAALEDMWLRFEPYADAHHAVRKRPETSSAMLDSGTSGKAESNTGL